MPRRTDLRSIFILGSGPIVIGQGCEFDYSGVQACKVLKQQGYRIVLLNSNPATIMTDPDLADSTYIEPMTVQIVENILEIERPNAILPTVGGQTGLNLAMDLWRAGLLERYGVELIGARPSAIELAEDRLKFKEAMLGAGLPVPQSGIARSTVEAEAVARAVGYPCLVRASFTLGGAGGGIARDAQELAAIVDRGVRLSPVGEVLVEESVLGWKEFELEVMRDHKDNFVVVCTIENIDPMGVHTGDSLTVAPAQTLSDRDYQQLRDMARQVVRTVGVETGGANVQFAVNPADGRISVIEMNPRVSRSSALASKATGFAIAKVAALLAVGYSLDEIPNDITRVTPASFEPSIDYCVVKLPRWNFEKFQGVDPTLGPQMKSIGEVMALGRTFPEALNKGIRSLETGRQGLAPDADGEPEALSQLSTPTAQRLFDVAAALWGGATVDQVVQATGVDQWFIAQIQSLVAMEAALRNMRLVDLSDRQLRKLKRHGFSDAQIARALDDDQATPGRIRLRRQAAGIIPTYLRVDTCAAEFEASTPYLYSSYESANEAEPTSRRKVVVLGGGPNRIGQGIEFDYCCVQACYAFRAMGLETIMINSNPETVSTDYDTADRLYFEPLTAEDVMNVIDLEKPDGIVVQFGGQTPINLAQALTEAGAPIWGTSPDAIALAEDRVRFGDLLRGLDIPHPEWGSAQSLDDARQVAARIGYPVMVRPSFVLGGRAMEIVYEEDGLAEFLVKARAASPDGPVLIDHYLEDAFEIDVDALGDGRQVVVAGVMQHIEEAGIHSGDSACVLPPYKVSNYHLGIIQDYTERLGRALDIRGLMNIQFAIKDDVVYVLEVNPRASRTVPFVSKATGVQIAALAARILNGRSLAELGFQSTPPVSGFFVKEAVLPFKKFPGADVRLGPEMRSTGEVMGHAARFGHAFAKAQMAAGDPLPTKGAALITVNDYDKGAALKIARDLHRLGFRLLATRGTAEWLARGDLPVEGVNKYSEGSPHVVDLIEGGHINLILNTPLGRRSHADTQAMRAAAVRCQVPLLTTLSAAAAAVNGIQALRDRALAVRSLQIHHSTAKAGAE